MNDMWKSAVAYGVGCLAALFLAVWLCGVKWWILPAAVVCGFLGQSLYLLACDLWDAWKK